MDRPRFLYILVMLAVTTTLFARPRFASDNNHYFGIYGQGGYSRMHPWEIEVTPLHGYTAGGGVLYEYEHGAFLMDIGCGFSWQQAGVQVADIDLPDIPSVDTQGDEYTLLTHVKRYDVYQRGLIDIPLLFGGQAGFFYGLAGVKVGVGLLDYSAMHAAVTTVGVYDKYFVPFHDQSNHGLRTDVPLVEKHAMLPELDIRASVELGAWLGEIETQGSVGVKARVALFADYGLFLGQVNPADVTISAGNSMDINRYRQSPVLATDGSHFLDNLMAGVKLTVLIGGESQSVCRNCRILNDRWRPIQYKKKCVICSDGRGTYQYY